ncbi:MAG: hypothetical protein K2L07_13090 [Lachnospiraceae bacterium]|nr:hypothetical protein [Lachnospiraceae bacterium]
MWVQVPSSAGYGAKSNRSGSGFALFLFMGFRLFILSTRYWNQKNDDCYDVVHRIIYHGWLWKKDGEDE